MSSWGSGLSIWIKIGLWKQGLLFFKAIQNHRQKRWNMIFGVLLFCNSTSDCLETAWVSSWGSGLSIWIEKGLWKQGVLFFRAIQIQRQIRYNVKFGELLLCNSTSDCLETIRVSSWSSGLSICIEIVLWKQGVVFFKAIQIHRQIRYNVKFGELLLCNSTSDCLETAGVSSWGSGLSIWIEIVLWKQGVLFFKAIHNHRQKRWNMRFWVLLLCNSKSDCLETAWVLSWGSGLSIWIEIVLWKQGVSFLDLSKITGMSGRVWDLESFYYLIQHQIVLKLLECHPGVVDCQSELEFLCGNREFAFESHPKSQTEDVEYEIWSACIM